jgi:hypothetical protein
MLKNVTITLPEETLRALRIAAATQGVSMSKYLAALEETTISGDTGASADHDERARIEAQRVALARFLALPKASLQLTNSDGKAPSKEWMNDRESLHRFQYSDLRFGSDEDHPNDPLRSVAEPPSPDWPDRPLSSGDQ